MSQYKTISINDIMASIISRTRLRDSSWYSDIYEWIIEGVKLMKLRQVLEQTSEEIEIVNHKVEYPCGLVSLDAVVYKGYRLPVSDNVIDITKNDSTVFTATSEFYNTSIETTLNTNSVTKVTTQTVKFPVTTYLTYPYNYNGYYKEFADYLLTSFSEGCVTIVFTKYPVDEEGYLLIPDNIDLKLALYYYVLNAMIGAGYQGSNVLNFPESMALWEKHSARAINQIKQPSTDKMEKLRNTITRLVQPLNYHQTFLSNTNI